MKAAETGAMKLRLVAFSLMFAMASGLAHAAPDTQNPFLAESPLPFHAPQFDRIKDDDYQPALDEGMRQQVLEIAAIANATDAPTFDNTIVAMERSGATLNRVQHVFEGISQANTDDAIEKIQSVVAPKLAAHNDAIYQDAKLFARVQTLYDGRETLSLDPVDRHLLEVTYQKFVKAGARLGADDQAKLRALNEEEAKLMTQFHDRVLADTNAAAVVVSDKAQLQGLSKADVDAAAAAAKDQKLSPGHWLLAMENTTQQPVLTNLQQRPLRLKVMARSAQRCDHAGPNDTRGIVSRLAALRAERAHLLGYSSAASYYLDDQMAKTPETAEKALTDLVPAATAKARGEAADLQRLIDREHGGFKLQAADWEYYAEKVRKARYDLDDAQVKPYFELDRVLHDGVFFAAHRLYGLTFKERKDLPVYHPDVRVFEVFDADGTSMALIYLDYYQRPSKSGGAWEDTFIDQDGLTGDKAVVYNVANFTKPAPGQPTLLDFDDVTTMFHEFGHGLHAMFSRVKYPSLAGTNVPRDFVEFPSQFNEHWAADPTVMASYAKHYRTGAPMPAALVAKLKKSSTFNQGYLTTEYLAAALLDLAWHTVPVGTTISNVDDFEATSLKRFGVAMPEVPPRYRSTFFSHIWDGGYEAGYYAYLWSEILDDDAFYWFKDHGGLTRDNGQRFRDMILSQGNSKDVADLYRAFLGRDPSVQPLLIERGLDTKK
jgi:peptidyl-dipeptidase Dcp